MMAHELVEIVILRNVLQSYSYSPFGFLLVMFPLGSSCFVFVFLPFDVSGGRCGIIVSIPDHCPPFYFDEEHLVPKRPLTKFVKILVVT